MLDRKQFFADFADKAQKHLGAAAAVYAEMAQNAEFRVQVLRAIWEMRDAQDKGRKPIFFGNGASAGDAIHFVTELTVQFTKGDTPLPAVALATDSAVITALGNDLGFEHLFDHQLKTVAQEGDVVVGITTSGNSENVVLGLKWAKERGFRTIAITGENEGKISPYVDLAVRVPSKVTAHIQEGTTAVIHVICMGLKFMK